MASKTSSKQNERVTSESLLESVDILTEYLHEELKEFAHGEEIPTDHVAFHVERLIRWRNQKPEIEKPETHNGWQNYETWLTALWLDNDKATHDYWGEQARATCEQLPPEGVDVFSLIEAASLELARQMKEEIEPDFASEANLYQDMLQGAFAEVNWFEVAMSFIEALN